MKPHEPDSSDTTPERAHGVERRVFLKVMGAVAAAAAGATPLALEVRDALADPDPPDNGAATAYIHSTCRLCEAHCGLKAKVVGGVVVKLEGSPYSPASRGAPLPFSRAPDATRGEFGRLCARGQAGVQHLYDPHRVQHPMRRVGARGAGRWETLTWDQAFREIGMRINALIPFSDRASRNVDPASPDLGRAANQLVYAPGSSLDRVLAERIFRSGYGTANWGLGDASLRRGNGAAVTALATRDHVTGAEGVADLAPDLTRAAYVIVFGPDPAGSVNLARGFADLRDPRRTGGAGRLVVVDPRLSNAAARADQWVPARPDGYAALALAIARVMIAGDRHDAAYLRNANKAAATAASRPTYSDATWLVVVEPGHPSEGRWLTPALAGLTPVTDARDPVCVRDADGAVVEVEVAGAGARAVVGRLLPADPGVDTITVNGLRCRTAFSLYRAAVFERSLDEYARLSGVDVATLTRLANDFAAAGPRAVAWCDRGALRSTAGAYAQLAALSLDWLVGNVDRAGGLGRGGGAWDDRASTGGTDLGAVTGAVTPAGPRIDRAGADYAATRSYHRGYPAPRPWFPFAVAGSWQELVPGIEDAYPYAAKALIMAGDAWPYEVPGGRAAWERVARDETRLPLLVAITPVMNEAAAWADYVLPEATYLESWGVPSLGADVPVRATPTQQPVAGAYDGAPIGMTSSWRFNPEARNEYTPVVPDAKMHADILLGIARAISPTLPGLGAGALGSRPLDRAWDLYRARFENVARNVGTGLTGASIAVGDVLARGGAFAPPESALDAMNPALLASRHGGVVHFYLEALAATPDPVTGRRPRGVAYAKAPQHLDGSPVRDEGFPWQLVTYAPPWHGTAEASASPWLTAIDPHNWVELSPADARTIDVETGDRVRVVSPSNPAGVVGVVKVVEGLRPGVVAVAHGYGRWENGARVFRVDGRAAGGDATRGLGAAPTGVMRLDAWARNAPLEDPVGGGAAFNDTWVRVEPVVGR